MLLKLVKLLLLLRHLFIASLSDLAASSAVVKYNLEI